MKRKTPTNSNTPLEVLKMKAVAYLKLNLAFQTRQAFLEYRRVNAKNTRKRLEKEENLVVLDALHGLRVRKVQTANSARDIFAVMFHATGDEDWERHFDEGVKNHYQAITTATEDAYFNPHTTIGKRLLRRRANEFERSVRTFQEK